ncbi:MAG: LD-carboxypeptidase [Clostridia bacterium]
MSKKLIKPKKLNRGDKVAVVSLSSGIAGDEETIWRYYVGKERLERIFGLKVVEMPHTLSGDDYIYNHPKKRAEDLMKAFSDKSIKAIFTCLGGVESIRMLPYIDFDIIKNNPKIFLGYSDTTTTNFICYKAGVSSFYGASVLSDFAENVQVPQYTIDQLNDVLFCNEAIGEILPPDEWICGHLDWNEDNKYTQREYTENDEYELLQGNGVVKGRLIGGCLEVLDMLNGTEIFPNDEDFNRAILFLETSDDHPTPVTVECFLRNFAARGILARLSGILFGKPSDEIFYDEYKEVIYKVLNEYNLGGLPVLYNLSFGHTEPKMCLPYGAMAEINCEEVTFNILESGVK